MRISGGGAWRACGPVRLLKQVGVREKGGQSRGESKTPSSWGAQGKGWRTGH